MGKKNRQRTPRSQDVSAAEQVDPDASADAPNHSGDVHSAFEWELSDEEEQELTACLRAALVEVQTDTLLDLLRKMSSDPLSYVMRSLGMPHAARVNRGMASALLARLRSRPSLDLLNFILQPLVEVFDHAHLDGYQWEALLSGDWDDVVEVLEEDPAFTWHLLKCEGVVPDALHRTGLVVAVLTSREPIPAWAFLARVDDRAAAAYEKVLAERESFPIADADFGAVLVKQVAETAATPEEALRVALAREAAADPHHYQQRIEELDQAEAMLGIGDAPPDDDGESGGAEDEVPRAQALNAVRNLSTDRFGSSTWGFLSRPGGSALVGL